MTQEAACLFLLRQGPVTCTQFIRSEFNLAASYRRALTMLRHRGYVITLQKAIKQGGVTVVPERYVLEAEPEPSGQRQMVFANAS